MARSMRSNERLTLGRKEHAVRLNARHHQDAGEIAFDHCTIQPAKRTVLIDGRPVAIGGRAFDLLLALVERRDRLVSKNELFDLVWPGLVVEENNLQVQIWTLRKLLGSAVIATIPRRGYRFVAEITGAAEDPVAWSAPLSLPPQPIAPGNLSRQLSPLVGRDDDLEALVAAAWGAGRARAAE
jgi:DNA-binding winged helix-turn-helix (wHTH) protein